MFLRFGYAQSEAEVRARIIYFTQIGYDALDQRESSEIRRSRAEDTLFCMTGARPTEAEVNKLKAMPLAMS